MKICHCCKEKDGSNTCSECKKPTCDKCFSEYDKCYFCIFDGMERVNRIYQPEFRNPEYPDEI